MQHAMMSAMIGVGPSAAETAGEAQAMADRVEAAPSVEETSPAPLSTGVESLSADAPYDALSCAASEGACALEVAAQLRARVAAMAAEGDAGIETGAPERLTSEALIDAPDPRPVAGSPTDDAPHEELAPLTPSQAAALPSLEVLARLTAAPGRAPVLALALTRLFQEMRDEPGCRSCAVHRSARDAHVFIGRAEWENAAAWRRHLAGPAVRRFNASVGGGVIASGELTPLAPLS